MTDKEILQGIDRLDAELPFDEICVGGKDNWHDIDVHELFSEIKERIKWHYPSRGEYPTETDDYLVYLERDGVGNIIIATYYVGAEEWCFCGDEMLEPVAWMPLPEPPKEEA